MQSLKYTFLLLTLLLFSACARGSSEIQPPTIHYGQDLCAECNMIISDPRYACGYLHEVSTEQYESIIFDDIGDMLSYAKKHPEHKIIAWYVHDFATAAWLDASQAHYVVSPAIQTPMGHGIAAHAASTAAQEMAHAVQGEVVEWTVLQAK